MSRTSDDTGAPAAASQTIMVVEPDILARMAIADYLRSCGYRVIEGATAEDVLVVLRSGAKVDVILAEVNLPGDRNGFVLAKQVAEAHADIDVILTAGAGKAADKAGELCDEGPLEKPYHPQDVLRRINLLRERRRKSTTRK
jgi:DNA-binding response OmpR family regulator